MQGGLREWLPGHLRGWHVEGQVADCARLCSGTSVPGWVESLAGVCGRGRTGIGQQAVPLLLRMK